MPKKKLPASTNTSFNDSYRELQSIIEWFEQEDVNLDEGMKKFAEASKLIKELKTYLQTMENTIKELHQD